MQWQGITLTNDAIKAARDLVQEDSSRQGRCLRIWLDGKGCDGFYYGINYDDATARDIIFETGGVEIIVDPDTIEFVDGSTVTWVDDDRGRGFLVENPRHKKFRGKFYKREHWQERLKARRQEHEDAGNAE